MTFDSYNPEGISKPVKLIVCSALAATAVGLFAGAAYVYHNTNYSQENLTNAVSPTNSVNGLEKVVIE